jgi:hypothetical protein
LENFLHTCIPLLIQFYKSQRWFNNHCVRAAMFKCLFSSQLTSLFNI